MNEAALHRWLARVVNVRPGEARALCWSFAYFFCLLAGYYVLRPLRDEMGIAGGVRNLPWLFTATFFVMLAVVPVFGAVVARLARRIFIPLVYHFFVANIAIFWLLLTLDLGTVHVARVFFVWISVFNLFAVSVFWSFMADLYASEQGKRLFGFIAAGGSAGALLGPALTVWLAVPLGPVNLLVVAALLLEVAVLCAARLEASAARLKPESPAPAGAVNAPPDAGLGGGWLAGIVMVLRSPYLAGIALWVALLSLAGTFLYFQQANIVAAASDDPAVRTRIFATIDLAIGVLTLIVQFVATGRLITRFGAGPAAAFLPLVFGLGFLALWASPALWVVIAFQAVQRAANFALSNPAREVLFTVLAREEKYKAKNVIDIVVFRGADALSGWLFALLRGAGLEPGAISLATVPVTAAWLALALVLGRAHERRTRDSAAPAATPTTQGA
ncbi:MAG: MFS transporter [Betaproteobacteria bacterium RIFCSPLOWO2_02_FULL_67_26]|nr:MAG: MFS transporter [Betaproteobacteria bacterium RIFCSPLOWO2_02_FULL_67_26]